MLERIDLAIINQHVTTIGTHQPHHMLEQDALARPRTTHQHRRAAVGHVHRDATQHLALAEPLVQVLDPDHSSTSAQNASSTRIAMHPSATARVVSRPTPSAPPRGAQPPTAADQRHRCPERCRLEQPEPEVLELVERPQSLGELGSGEVEQVHAGDPPRRHADRHREGGDHREHQRRREHPRHHQVGARIPGEGLEGVDLLGHLHRAELGGDVGADPAGQRHAGQHRSELHHHGLADQRADEVHRHRAGEDVRRQQCQHDPGEHRDEGRDRHRGHAEALHLGEELGGPGTGVAKRADRAERGPAEGGDRRGGHGPKIQATGDRRHATGGSTRHPAGEGPCPRVACRLSPVAV